MKKNKCEEENMKKLVMYFDRMQDVHLFKDVGMVPYYIAKEFDFNLEYITADDCNSEEFRGYSIKKIKRFPNFKINIFFIFYLIKNAKTIDILMTIHCRNYNLIIGKIYKMLNPKGFYFIKADQNYDRNVELNDKINQKKISKVNKWKLESVFKMLKYVDLLSFEQKKTYNHVKENGICNINIKEKIVLLENGFDDFDNNIYFNNKENLIITSGRIGAPGKNHEFLIDVLEKINLENWKVYFVGPIDREFEKIIEERVKNNILLKEKIYFTGNIEDKKELNEYYKRAKIFCFTSEVEGYPLVFPEASFFGNYIFTTDVGGAEDITEQGKYGKIIEQNNAYKYTEELQKIIDNPIFLEEKISKIVERKNELTWSNRIRNENRIFEIFKKKGILKNEKD